MNETEMRLKTVANEIAGIRSTSGSTSSTLVFGLLALLKSKNKITQKDIDIIFEVENQGMSNTLDRMFEHNYGDSNFEIKNEQELEATKEFCREYVDSMKKLVTGTAEELAADSKPKRQKKATDDKV